MNLISIVPIIFYKLSGKKMAEIQGRLAVKRLEDAKRLEGIVDGGVRGETDIYSVVAEKAYEEELAEEEATAQSAVENVEEVQTEQTESVKLADSVDAKEDKK